VDDSHFKNLLVRAAKEDPLMKEAQDEFFDKAYWTPAFKWFTEQEFTLPLSMLVILRQFYPFRRRSSSSSQAVRGPGPGQGRGRKEVDPAIRKDPA
jgi:hypothetical protein